MAKVGRRIPPPSVHTLLLILENTPVRVVERAYVHETDREGVTRRKECFGYYDHDKKEIVISRRKHRGGRAPEMVRTLIHELLHRAVPYASEWWVRRKDLVYYGKPELVQAAAMKLLDSVLFGDKEH